MRVHEHSRTGQAALATLLLALLTACAFAASSAAAPAHSDNFPSRGIVVPGKSIGGIAIGMTESQVQKRWGHGYEICTTCGKKLVWLYEYPGSEPLGAAVKFDVPNKKEKKGVRQMGATTPVGTGKVVSVFTLGSPLNWGVPGKVKTFGPVTDIYTVYGTLDTVHCIGYDALTVRVGHNTMSFYTASGVVYGFALTAPSEPACQ